MSRLSGAALAVSLCAVIAAGAIGVWRSTALDELACEYVGVGINEPSSESYHSTPLAAATAAVGVDESGRPAAGVVDITDADPAVGDMRVHGERVFAIRVDGRTVGFLSLGRGSGNVGWAVTSSVTC